MTVSSGNKGRTADLQSARRLLGSRFIGPQQWTWAYPNLVQQHDWDAISPFPWSVALLESECPFTPGLAIRQTHIAFLGLASLGGYPLTLWRWKSLQPAAFNAHATPWYRYYPFAQRPTCGNRWYLMPVWGLLTPNAQTYDDHLALLPSEYEVPLAVEETTKLLLFRHLNGGFPSIPSRSSSIPYTWNWCQEAIEHAGAVRQVVLSNTGMQRLKVGAFSVQKMRGNLGLAASRKLPRP